MDIKLLEVITIVLTFQMVFFATYLLFFKPRQLHKILLATFLLSKAMVYMVSMLIHTFQVDWLVQNPVIREVAFGFMFVLHPLIFFYTFSLLIHDFRIRYSHLFHTLPFLIYQVFMPGQIFAISAVQKEFLVYSVFFIQTVVYYSLSISNTLKYNEPDTTRKRWLLIMLTSLFMLWITYSFYCFSGLIMKRFSMELLISIEIMFFVMLLGLMYVALYFGKIFNSADCKKYHYSRISETDKQQYCLLLDDFMCKQQAFLDPELTLEKMANQLQMSVRTLSQILNEKKGMNFHEYINSFRLQKSMELLAQAQTPKKTIQEIIYESGFNSKTVFYNLFLEHTGMTPKLFRDSLKAES